MVLSRSQQGGVGRSAPETKHNFEHRWQVETQPRSRESADRKKKEDAFHIDFLCLEQNSVFGLTSETRAGPHASNRLPGSQTASSQLPSERYLRCVNLRETHVNLLATNFREPYMLLSSDML